MARCRHHGMCRSLNRPELQVASAFIHLLLWYFAAKRCYDVMIDIIARFLQLEGLKGDVFFPISIVAF